MWCGALAPVFARHGITVRPPRLPPGKPHLLSGEGRRGPGTFSLFQFCLFLISYFSHRTGLTCTHGLWLKGCPREVLLFSKDLMLQSLCFLLCFHPLWRALFSLEGPQFWLSSPLPHRRQ